MEATRKMTHRRLVLVVIVCMLLVGPAHAYSDPTGGALFQILMPILAAIWGTWLVLARSIRRGISHTLRRLRGIEPEDPAA